MKKQNVTRFSTNPSLVDSSFKKLNKEDLSDTEIV